MPQTGEHYRHYKGNEYEVLTLAANEGTGEMLVIYQDTYDARKTWARPLSQFIEKVTVDGRTIPRFSKMFV